MGYNEIEKRLKQDAEKFKPTDFNVRWEHVVAAEKAIKNGENPCTISEKVTAMAADGGSANCKSGGKNRYVVFAVVFAVLVLIALAIALPIALTKNKKVYFNESDLSVFVVTQEEFYQGVMSAEIDLIDTDEHGASGFKLFYYGDEVKGGGCELVVNGAFCTLSFYDSDIVMDSNAALTCELCTDSGCVVKYSSDLGGGYYTISAIAVYSGTNYKFSVISSNNDVQSLFNEILK